MSIGRSRHHQSGVYRRHTGAHHAGDIREMARNIFGVPGEQRRAISRADEPGEMSDLAQRGRLIEGIITEQENETGELIRKLGNEFGTTTGRPRRCGWFDAVAVRYTARLSGVTRLALMMMDVLAHLDELKVCIAYELDGERIELNRDEMWGTKDRSWGVRPLIGGDRRGAPPKDGLGGIFFLWAPLNFDDFCLHYQLFDDKLGRPLFQIGAKLPVYDSHHDLPGVEDGAVEHMRNLEHDVTFKSGNRMITAATLKKGRVGCRNRLFFMTSPPMYVV